MVRIEYRLSSAGQKANLVAGGDGKSIQRITVKHGDPLYPEAVALATEYYDSKASANYWEVSCSSNNGGRFRDLVYDFVPTVATLLADQRARVDAYEEKQRVEKARQDAEAEAGVLELVPKSVEECIYRNSYGSWDRLAGWWSEPRIAAKGEAALAEAHRRNKMEGEEKAAAKANAEKVKREAMRAWIELNGSSRLRNCLREGIKCDGLYYTERLAAEYPGWERYDKIEGKCSDPINPPEEAFTLLEDARKQIPEAKLQYYVDDGIRLYCGFAEWPTHPEEIDLVYFGDQEWELQPDEQD